MKTNIDNAYNQALNESEYVKIYFMEKFEEMKEVLDLTLEELKEAAKEENCTTDKITKIQSNLDWLERIKNKFDEIVEI